MRIFCGKGNIFCFQYGLNGVKNNGGGAYLLTAVSHQRATEILWCLWISHVSCYIHTAGKSGLNLTFSFVKYDPGHFRMWRSDTYPMFWDATSIWRVMSYFTDFKSHPGPGKIRIYFCKHNVLFVTFFCFWAYGSLQGCRRSCGSLTAVAL